MIETFDKFLLSDKKCEQIISDYKNKVEMISVPSFRKYKSFHEYNSESWLHEIVNELIKNNLGNEYRLLQRVTVLKYETGDFFEEHIDGTHNYKLDNRLPYHFYGGVELCNKFDFVGGEFHIEGIDVDYKKGRVFTHGFYNKHGVKQVKSGTRWSIHFLIYTDSFADYPFELKDLLIHTDYKKSII